jgi:hypothetical protein
MTHPMEPLGDMNQVKSRFSLFGDSVSVDARLVHGLCHGTIQIIRAEVQNTITEVIKFSHLSPYNSGSPMKSRGI